MNPGLAYDAVVFDLDGTLVDTFPSLVLSLNLALSRLGLGPVPDTLVSETLHGGFETSAAAALAFHGAAPALQDELTSFYQHSYESLPQEAASPYPGVRDLLALLKTTGRRLAVCTNKLQVSAEDLLRKLAMRQYFDVVVGADTCSQKKPHAEPLLYAINALGVSRSNTLFVGDSVVDVECARNAEVDCTLYAGGYGGLELERYDAVPRFHSHLSLIDYVLPALGLSCESCADK